MQSSITRRLLLVSTTLVAAFAGLAGWSLDSAFRHASKTVLIEQLQAHVYTLLATAREDARGRPRLPQALPDPVFNRPDSGRYARVVGENGAYRWQSPSLLGRDLPTSPPPAVGQRRIRHLGHLLVLEQTVAWEDFTGAPIPYTFTIAADTRDLERQQADFRTTLWGWLALLSLILLGVQLAAVRWGLRPLYRLAGAIKQIEQGRASRLPDEVPLELRPLTDNLDALLTQAQTRQERVRHSLADLAHSLKTPLTVLRGATDPERCPELSALVEEQVQRIDEIVSYQRQRAAVAGSTALSAPVALRPLLERLGRGLAKLHADRDIRLSIDLDDSVHLRMDEGDLMELFGNLLENAFRHARKQVRVCRLEGRPLSLEIADDGPGLPPGMGEALLARGVRGDERHPGEGIGLAVVREILQQYGASIRIGRSALGGAGFVLTFP